MTGIFQAPVSGVSSDADQALSLGTDGLPYLSTADLGEGNGGLTQLQVDDRVTLGVSAHVAETDPHSGKYAPVGHTHTLLMTQSERDKLAALDLASPLDGQVIKWSAALSKWVPAADNEGSGGASKNVETWSALLAVASPTAGERYTVLAPVIAGGRQGTQWAHDGTLWRPACSQVIYSSTTSVSGPAGGSTTETAVVQTLVAAGVLAGANTIRIRSRFSASGSDPASKTLRFRLGPNGSNADTQIMTRSSGAAALTEVVPLTVMPVSSTSMRTLYSGTSAQSPDAVTSATAVVADITVPDLTQALYFSVTAQSGNSPTSTISIVAVQILVE